MKIGLRAWVTALVMLVTLSMTAGTIEAPFDAANKLYAENKFTEAAVAYEKIITSGSVSPALYFNLGNARFKAGQIGHAIAAYSKAGAMTPRDPDVVANLKFARNQVQGPTMKPGAVVNLFSTLTLNEWTWLAAGSVWILFALMIARQIRPTSNSVLRGWTFISAGVALLFCVALALAYSQSTANKIVIVTSKEATVRNSPLEQAPSMFVVQDGSELRVLDTKDEWLQVTDGTRRIGWVKSDMVITSGS